jgi:hypothetical protein
MNIDWQSFWTGAGLWAFFSILLSWLLGPPEITHLVICDSCKDKLREGPYR